MTLYQCGAQQIDTEAQGAQGVLAELYTRQQRPICPCQPAGLEMYIAKAAGVYIVKRMPHTGPLHTPECDSYEPPPELSGLGDLADSAITENAEDGTTAIKLGFSLTKVGGRAAPTNTGIQADTVQAESRKLTLRAMLHYLWDDAQFTRWLPRMAGKRSYRVIRRYLLQAASTKNTKAFTLSDAVYMPEHWTVDEKAAIAGRRSAKLSRLALPEKGKRQLMIAIGDVKSIEPSRYGHKIVLRHAPDWVLYIDEDLHKRLLKRFANEFELWGAFEESHLVIIATFGLTASGLASVEEAALMLTSDDWLPFETAYDKQLLDVLRDEGRSFTRGMRYNLSDNRPLAAAVLSDCRPRPAALYVLPPTPSADYYAALAELVEHSQLAAWFWNPAKEAMPPLPPRQDFEPMALPSIAAEEPAPIAVAELAVPAEAEED